MSSTTNDLTSWRYEYNEQQGSVHHAYDFEELAKAPGWLIIARNLSKSELDLLSEFVDVATQRGKYQAGVYKKPTLDEVMYSVDLFKRLKKLAV
jgi:hypothetical protein